MNKFLRRFHRRFASLLAILALTFACGASAATSREVVAAVLIAEAGGEGVAAMQAVREVIQMRAFEKRTAELKVVTAKWQFSCLNKTTPEKLVARASLHPRWPDALALASRYVDKATVRQANHYHHKSVAPYWAKDRKPLAFIGGHYFYKL